MKNVWVAIALFALSSTVGFAQQAQEKGEGPSRVLSRQEFDALVAHPEQVLILDVRRPDEIQTIGGFSVYLNVQPADLEKSLAWIPRERTIIAISNHANRAIRVANALAAKGFKLGGTLGVQNYEEQGGTLVKIVKPAVSQNAAQSAPTAAAK